MWARKYTPLAGIATVETSTDVLTLGLPDMFMPTGFEKLVEHGFGPERRIERVPVDDLREAVLRYKRVVVLGEPGSGKTTTLWRLVYDYAKAAEEDPQRRCQCWRRWVGTAGRNRRWRYVTQAGEFGADLPAT